MAAGQQRRAYQTLDGIRGVGAVLVVMRHVPMLFGPVRVPESFLAVDLFYLVSGFVVAHAYGERLKAGGFFVDFVKTRLIRLYPLYLAGTLIGFAALTLKMMAGSADYGFSGLEKALQYNLLFLPYLNTSFVVNFGRADVGQLFPTNVAAWSLFFELFVNLVFARIAGMKLARLWVVVALSLAAYFAALLVTSAQPGWSSGN
ncbi:MAG: acyltransferase, partial [Caulobacteraceae bacterium]|nr:acyltransferase [Caulobacteraceae bacterium]